MQSPLSVADTTGLASQDISWYDIPGVQILGVILGTLLLLAALRSMFGKGGR